MRLRGYVVSLNQAPVSYHKLVDKLEGHFLVRLARLWHNQAV